MDVVIPDEDFDRLWDEAVAEAAVKSINIHKSHSSNRKERSKSSRSREHPSKQSNRRSSELQRRKKLSSNSDEIQSSWRVHKPPLSPVITEVETRSTIPCSSSNSVPGQRSQSKSPVPSSLDESSSHELPHRRTSMSSISRVPSLPSFHDNMSKHTMYGREDLSALSYFSSLEPSSSRRKQHSMEESVSSLISGFSGFESVSIQGQSQNSYTSETRLKQISKTRSKSRSPTRDAKKRQHNVDAQHEAVNYILEAKSSEQQRLLFEIPATFAVKGLKENRNQSTGLVLSSGKENETGTVMVKEISYTSLFASTRLKSGHEILMINSHRVKCPQQAAKIMKSLRGDVTIYVSEGTRAPGMKYIRVKVDNKKKMNGSASRSTTSSLLESSTISTEDIDRSLHIAAKDVSLVTQNNGLVRVAHVDPHGTFRNNLKAGDIVITVNGVLIQDDEEAKKQLLDTVNHGVVCMLIYSMADLCKGLINQLLSGWKRFWVSEVEVTVSRDDVSFSVVWGDDWACECNRSEEAGYNSDIKPALEKINWATSLVIKSLIEASEVQHKQSTLDADCNTCTATTVPTSEESTDDDKSDESCELGREPKVSRQTTDPTIEADTDDDVRAESGHDPTETSQESSKSNRPSLRPGKSLFFELHHGDDESSVEEC